MFNWLTFFAADTCNKHFLGLKPWHAYLPKSAPPECIVNFDLQKNAKEAIHIDQIWLIALAILDDLLRIAGIVAVFFVIYGGIRYMVSQGEPENTKAALGTITNALVGLAIAMIGAAVVSFIGNKLGG